MKRKTLPAPSMLAPLVVGYVRVSTLSQVNDGDGLGVQRDKITGWCSFQGLPAPHIEQDAAVSGASTENRPGLHRALRAVFEHGKGAVLVVYKLDRLGRNAIDVQEVVRGLPSVELTRPIVVTGTRLPSEVSIMLKKTLFSAVFLSGTSVLLACSGSTDQGEGLGGSSAAIDEIPCAYRTVSTPNNGAIVPELTSLGYSGSYCFFDRRDSTAQAYNYANCTNAFIVEYQHTNPYSNGSRRWSVTAQAKNEPTTQTDCQNTWVKFYVYGTDADEVPWRWKGAPETGSVKRGTWTNYGSAQYYCDWSWDGPINLDDFANQGGASVSVVTWRVVAQAYTDTDPNGQSPDTYIPVSVFASGYDKDDNCIH